jgi:hypothetical protein
MTPGELRSNLSLTSNFGGGVGFSSSSSLVHMLIFAPDIRTRRAMVPSPRFVLRPKAETLSDTPMRSLSVAQLLLRPYASMLIHLSCDSHCMYGI